MADDGGTLGVTGTTAQVQLAPGSDPVNLDDVTVELYPDGQDRTSTPTSSGES